MIGATVVISFAIVILFLLTLADFILRDRSDEV